MKGNVISYSEYNIFIFLLQTSAYFKIIFRNVYSQDML